MSLLRRINISFHQYGLRTSLFRLIPWAVDRLYDLRYGTKTSGWSELDELKIDSENKKRGSHYKPTKVLPLTKLLTVIKPMMPTDGVFVDFGCGKGRVLMVASLFGFRAIRGVEFAHELCEIAKNNIVIHRDKTNCKAECQIIECDVTDYHIREDENVFFMNCPFDGTILHKVLNNISASLLNRSRKILIIYHNPKYAHVLDERDDFRRIEQLDFWGNSFILYSNDDDR